MWIGIHRRIGECNTSYSMFLYLSLEVLGNITFWSGKRSHEQNGGVENAIKSLKQSFKSLQSDFETMKASLGFRPVVN